MNASTTLLIFYIVFFFFLKLFFLENHLVFLQMILQVKTGMKRIVKIKTFPQALQANIFISNLLKLHQPASTKIAPENVFKSTHDFFILIAWPLYFSVFTCLNIEQALFPERFRLARLHCSLSQFTVLNLAKLLPPVCC